MKFCTLMRCSVCILMYIYMCVGNWRRFCFGRLRVLVFLPPHLQTPVMNHHWRRKRKPEKLYIVCLIARELVVYVLLLLYCHQVHSPRVLEKCLFRTIVIFVDSTSGWTLFCIWSSAMLMNRYFKLFFTLLATIKRRTSSSFLLLLLTMHM